MCVLFEDKTVVKIQTNLLAFLSGGMMKKTNKKSKHKFLVIILG